MLVVIVGDATIRRWIEVVVSMACFVGSLLPSQPLSPCDLCGPLRAPASGVGPEPSRVRGKNLPSGFVLTRLLFSARRRGVLAALRARVFLAYRPTFHLPLMLFTHRRDA